MVKKQTKWTADMYRLVHAITLLYFQASVDKTTNWTCDISRLVDDLSNNPVLFYLFQASVD